MKLNDRRHYRREQVQALLYEVSFFLELAAAVLVIILIVFQVVGLGMEMFSDTAKLTDSDSFTHFLELCLNVVVGIEFLKMLCRHNMDAVIEVLLFTLARHLIISRDSMAEGLLCIVGIAILFVVRKYLFIPQIDKPHYFHHKNDEPTSEDREP